MGGPWSRPSGGGGGGGGGGGERRLRLLWTPPLGGQLSPQTPRVRGLGVRPLPRGARAERQALNIPSYPLFFHKITQSHILSP